MYIECILIRHCRVVMSCVLRGTKFSFDTATVGEIRACMNKETPLCFSKNDQNSFHTVPIRNEGKELQGQNSALPSEFLLQFLSYLQIKDPTQFSRKMYLICHVFSDRAATRDLSRDKQIHLKLIIRVYYRKLFCLNVYFSSLSPYPLNDLLTDNISSVLLPRSF